MKRSILIALSALLLRAATMPIGGAQQQQEPRFRAGTHAVSVYTTVVDATGRLVPNLTQDDFEVFDNGTPQALSLFANSAQPIAVVVMIDRSSSVEPHFDLVKNAAGVFVNTLLPSDRARIGSFSYAVRLDPDTFTSDRAQLHDVLDHKLQEAGETPLWRAMITSMDALGDETSRRVVLVFSDGKDSSSALVTYPTFADVRRRVEAEDVMVYTVGLAIVCGERGKSKSASMPTEFRLAADLTDQSRGRLPPRRGLPPPPIGRPPGFPEPGRIPPIPPVDPFGRPPKSNKDEPPPCRESKPDPGLQQLADLGGGGYFELSGPADLERTFARVADELHHQYLLAFPAPIADGQVHTIEVRVKPPNLTVRARKSYLAPPPK